MLQTGAAALVAATAGCLNNEWVGGGPGAGVGWDRRFAVGAVAQFRRVIPTADGGFVAVGHTAASDEHRPDGLIVRTDRSGVEQWRHTVAGVGLLDAVTTADGGVVAVGNSSTRGPFLDGWAVRLAADGSERWRRELGTDGASPIVAVERASDGGFLLAGSYGYPDDEHTTRVAYLEADGTPRWDVPSVLAGVDGAVTDFLVTPTGFLLTGAGAGGAMDGLAGEVFAPAGDTRWSRRYGTAFSRAVAVDGGFVLLSTDGAVGTAPVVTRIDAEGAVVWSYAYRPSAVARSFSPEDLAATPDGGYLVAGSYGSWAAPASVAAPVVAKVRADGAAVEWVRTFDDGGNAQSVVALADGYVLAGSDRSGAARLLRFDAPADADGVVTLRVRPVEVPSTRAA